MCGFKQRGSCGNLGAHVQHLPVLKASTELKIKGIRDSMNNPPRHTASDMRGSHMTAKPHPPRNRSVDRCTFQMDCQESLQHYVHPSSNNRARQS